jgi:hypothetical protein
VSTLDDSDELAADHARSAEERREDHKRDVRFDNAPSRRRRTIYLSEEVYRDGEPVRLEEVLVVDDDEPHPDDVREAEPPADADPFWAPDRLKHPYAWERFWRDLMRHDLRSGQWRGTTQWERVIWYCQRCRKPLPEVKSKGRPPRWCGRACQQAAYRERRSA